MTEAIEYLRQDPSCVNCVSDCLSTQRALATGAVIVEMPAVEVDLLASYVERFVQLFLRGMPWEPSLLPPRALVVYEEGVLDTVAAVVAPFVKQGTLHAFVDVPEGTLPPHHHSPELTKKERVHPRAPVG
jgi:hypothetical protein